MPEKRMNAMTTIGQVEEESAAGSLTQQAYRQIEELIVTLQLEPGSVLSEATLAKQIGIGRTPIREALQRLAREGLINILPRRGILVSELNVKRQLRLLELRREIERLIARKSAERASADERKAFREIAAGMKQASEKNDDITFMRLDRQLNLLLCRAARNEFATNAMSLTHGMSRRFWYSHYKQVADLPRCARLHADLADAVAAGDPDEASAAADSLVDYVESFTRATLDVEGHG